MAPYGAAANTPAIGMSGMGMSSFNQMGMQDFRPGMDDIHSRTPHIAFRIFRSFLCFSKPIDFLHDLAPKLLNILWCDVVILFIAPDSIIVEGLVSCRSQPQMSVFGGTIGGGVGVKMIMITFYPRVHFD